MNQSLTLLVVLFVMVFLGNLNVSAQQCAAGENAEKVLAVLGLSGSVIVIECFPSHVIARPAKRLDGSVDNRLWEFIQKDRTSPKPSWIHDNIVLSSIQGYGKHSYRQNDRPSMQAIFYWKNGQIEKIKLDLDRFAPGGHGPVSSVRHLIQERLPNLFLRRKTDQVRMSKSLEKRYGIAKKTGPEVVITGSQ